MAIVHMVPIFIVVIYIGLMLVTLLNRAHSRQHKLFMLYLVPAISWSLADFLMRGPWLESEKLLIFRIVIVSSMWMVLQLYFFVRIFLGLKVNSVIRLGYVVLAVFAAFCFAGIIPPSVTVDQGHVVPEYNWWIIMWVTPMVYIIGAGLPLLVKRWKSSSPEERNKLGYLIIAIGFMVVFGLAAVTPLTKTLPVGHIGLLIGACILTFATIREDLISINVFLRRGLGWASTIAIGIGVYDLLLLAGKLSGNLFLNASSVVYLTLIMIAVFTITYIIKPVFLQNIDKLFYRERYEHRKRLLDYIAHDIRRVSNLQELGNDLLRLLAGTLEYQQAFMLLTEKPGSDFTVKFSYPLDDNSLQFIIRREGPITSALYNQHLRRKEIDTRPEFRGLWASERNGLNKANIELLFPLMSRGMLIGILALGRKKQGIYSVDDINLVESITNTVAISIEKERYQTELAKREKELSIINRLTRVITSSLKIQDVYDSFVLGLRETVDVDFATISLIADDNVQFSAVYNTGKLPWKAGDSIQLKGSGIEWMVLNKKYLIYPNPKYCSEAQIVKQIMDLGFKSIVFLPLITKDEVIGVLTLACNRENAYNPDQIQFLEQLASQISTSVANAQLYSSAEKRARVDELTGLSNRRHFDESIDKEIHRHFRYGSMISLILIDTDHFKSYNDLMGHVNGDKLLKKVAQIIKNNTREVDQSFRYGGDEFAIILPSASTEDAIVVAERIRQRIESELQNENIPVTASFGIAGWPNDGISSQDLINSADQALYHAKRTGQNRVCTAAQILPLLNMESSQKDQTIEKETLNTIYALAATIEARDRYTYGHSRKVRTYAVALAEAIKLPPEKVAVVSHAALLHDIGKIGIYDTVLNKPDILTREERTLIQSHPELSRAIVAHVSNLAPCLPAILHHHERWDGKGYPQGLKGENIPLEARILTIADSFDAMTSARPYRDPLSCDEVISELKKCSGTQFDADLVEVFLPIAMSILSVPQPVSAQ